MLARLGLSMPRGPEAVPSFANESAWGGPELQASPFVFGPYGYGAHLDRARFDASLANAAEDAGATVLLGLRVTRCEPVTERLWRLHAAGEQLSAAAVIFATGRRAGLVRELGARRRLRDRLVGIAVQYTGGRDDGGSTLVEAAPEGWWYSAALPRGRRIVALMTDPDICRAGRYTDPTQWGAALAATRHTADRVAGLIPRSRPHSSSAASHRLERAAAPGGWLAVGDAAMGVDPLSGSGLSRALLTGEAAGTAIAHWLVGRPEPADAYERWLDARFADYWSERAAYYALEKRWPDAPFWRRRGPNAEPAQSEIEDQ
jgi:flavin-dependent dehydrogenase